MNISKEQFTKLAKEHLIALESYKMDKNGNKPIEIFGIEKLYEAINVIQCCEPLKGVEAMQFEQWLCKYKFEKINDETYRKGRSDYDVKQLLKLYKITH